MNIFALHKLSHRFLIYGTYAVLCHIVAVFFHALTNNVGSSELLALRHAPLLEHSVMSLVIVITGTLLIELTLLDIKKNR